MSDGFNAIGCSNHTTEKRAEYDFYATDPHAVDVLLNECKDFTLSTVIWEPACGVGHISNKLKEAGYHVVNSDIVDRGCNDLTCDFLQYIGTRVKVDIVTNPPYKMALEFVKKALDMVDEGVHVVMFLKLQFLEGKERKEFFRENQPKYVYVFSKRVMCAKNGDFDGIRSMGGSTIAYAWYVWEKGYKGDTTLKWVN